LHAIYAAVVVAVYVAAVAKCYIIKIMVEN
jgi:hypothetical protein